jgi:hypothetical protein
MHAPHPAITRGHQDRLDGHFLPDDRGPRARFSAFRVGRWKERPGMPGLRFYFNERHKESWMTDGTISRRGRRKQGRRAPNPGRCDWLDSFSSRDFSSG